MSMIWGGGFTARVEFRVSGRVSGPERLLLSLGRLRLTCGTSKFPADADDGFM